MAAFVCYRVEVALSRASARIWISVKTVWGLDLLKLCPFLGASGCSESLALSVLHVMNLLLQVLHGAAQEDLERRRNADPGPAVLL